MTADIFASLPARWGHFLLESGYHTTISAISAATAATAVVAALLVLGDPSEEATPPISLVLNWKP